MLTKKEFGKWGENLAAEFLKKKNYKILAKNIYSKYGEIDLLCQLQGQIICVEVKTRTSNKIDFGILAVTCSKIKKIILTWHWYRSQHSKLPAFMRIEAVVVMVDKNKISYRHFLEINFIDT